MGDNEYQEALKLGKKNIRHAFRRALSLSAGSG